LIRSTVGELLTTAEAAHRLGVETATLYAYVSRGLLRSHRTPGGRGSRFEAAEVDALAGRGRSPRRPTGTVETVRSALTSLDGDRLRYRGLDAVELSRGHSFEAVARLLWTGTATPGPFASDPELSRAARGVLDGLPAGTRAPDRLRVAVAVVAALLPRTPDPAPEAVLGAVVGALAPGASVARSVARALGRPDVALDAPLVLLADHGLAVSTLAARVAASARAPLTSVLAAALGAADGPLHAAATADAHRLLARAVADPPASVVRAAGERRADGTLPAGFGHLLYAGSDPRAEELLAGLPPGPVTDVLPLLLERVVRVHGATAFPDVDLGLAAFAHAHGLPAEAGELIFEVGRTAGWIAHALEERTAPPLRFRRRGLQGA
jgi:citrate synthase